MAQVVVEALTFDDVVLLPGRSRVEPWQVDLTSKPSTNTVTHIPLVSAPMDTVTEWKLAAALALHGGLGVIHRNMSIEEQVEHVRKVKNHPLIWLTFHRFEPGFECCRARQLLEALGLRDLPVVNDKGVVVGHLRLSMLKSCECGKPVSYDKPVTASAPEEALALLERGVSDSVALVENGKYIGTVTVEEVFKNYSPATDDSGRLLVGAAISPFDVERAKKLDKHVDVLVFDVAHFHNDNVIRAARRVVEETSADIVVGNIGTAEAVVDTVSALERVNGLRVGIAGGNICTTSGVAGVASPTLHAVLEARKGLEQLGVSPEETPIIADGGIRGSGDAVKALAAGAYTVMAGFLLAGTDEAAAPLIRVGGSAYKPYRGMASRGAMEKRFAVDRYSRAAKRVEEGIEGLVPYKGPVSRVVAEFAEGLRAGLGYAGAASIPELWAKARFARVNTRIGAFMGTLKTSI